MAHLFVDGAESSGSERPAHVAQSFAVLPAQLPRAHYIALGHIHKPQAISASSPCLYAGSPLQLDFGERGQQKRVVIVDAQAECPASVESIPLASGRRLREVVTTMDKLKATAEEVGDDFVRVVVRAPAKIASLAQHVSAALPNAVAVQQEFTLTPSAARPSLDLSNPRERFRQFVREQKNAAAPAELLEAFDRLYEEARHEANEA